MDGTVLCRGEEVDVVGPSSKRGHLIVKNRDLVMDVPYHLLDLKVRLSQCMPEILKKYDNKLC